MMYVWSEKATCGSNLFSNRSVVVLIDPTEAASGGVSFCYGCCRLIYVASNDKNHFKNYDKVTPYYKRYLGVPSTAELKIALKYMSKDILDSSLEQQGEMVRVMIKRANVIGNLPRYLLTADAFKVRQVRAESALDNLDDATLQKVIKWDGIVDERQTYTDISNFIFSVNAASASFQAGYDGVSGIDYRIQRLAIMSNVVLDKVVGTNRERILSFWAVVGNGQLGCMSSRIKDFCWQELNESSISQLHQMSNDR